MTRNVLGYRSDIASVIKEYEPYAFTFAAKFCASHPNFVVDDVTQELLITIFNIYPKYDPTKGDIKTYFTSCFIHKLRNILDKSMCQKRNFGLPDVSLDNTEFGDPMQIADSGQDIETLFLSDISAKLVEEILNSSGLSKIEYCVMYNRIFNPDIPFEKIASKLQISRQGAHSAFNAAKQKICNNPYFLDIVPHSLKDELPALKRCRDRSFYKYFYQFSYKWVEYICSLLNEEDIDIILEKHPYGIDFPEICLDMDDSINKKFDDIIIYITDFLSTSRNLISCYKQKKHNRIKKLKDYLYTFGDDRIDSNLIDLELSKISDSMKELIQKRFGRSDSNELSEFEIYELVALCEMLSSKCSQPVVDMKNDSVKEIVNSSSFFKFFCENYEAANADIVKRDAEILCLLLGRVNNTKFSIQSVAEKYRISVDEVKNILEKAKNMVSLTIPSVSRGYCYKKCYNIIGGNNESY